MVPVLDKNSIKVITQNITPEQVEYVAGVNSIMQDCKNVCCDANEDDKCEDILYVMKIMAFADRFKTLHWGAENMSYHKALDEFWEELESYKDAIAENIQSIIGFFEPNDFAKLELPVGDNPLEVINELKQCVVNWFELHQDNMEYEGCRNATSGFIEIIHKYVYLFRLCKINGR